LNQILKRQTSRSHYGSKAPAVTKTVFKYRNKIGKIVVKTVPYSVNVNVKNTFTSHIDKKIFLTFFLTSLSLYIFTLLTDWLGYGVKHHFQQYLGYIVAVNFIGGRNRSTWRKLTCRKSLTHKVVSSTPRHEQDSNSLH
jgi:hypothetical protein